MFTQRFVKKSIYILTIVILSSAGLSLAWTEPGTAPPGGNVAVPLNTGSTNQTKIGELTASRLYVSSNEIYLSTGNEGDLKKVNNIIGYNDLFLKSSASENNTVYVSGSDLQFWSGGSAKLTINSSGSLTAGSVPWARLTSFPTACTSGQFATGVGSTLTCAAPPAVTALDWTALQNYPAACSAGQFMNAVGDTITCATPAGGLANAFSSIADSGGTVQFSASGADTLRMAASAGLSVAFAPATKSVTYSIADSGVTNAKITAMDWTKLQTYPTACTSGQFVTAVGDVLTCATPAGSLSGSGTQNYVAKFTNTTVLGNSSIFDDGTNVGLGTASPTSKLSVVQGGIGLGMIGLYDGVNNDPTNYMQLGEDKSWTQYIANNAYYTGTQYNYVNTGGYGGTASRIAQTSGTIQFDTASGGTNPITWNNRMYITNAGTIGIGTGSPDPNFKLTTFGGGVKAENTSAQPAGYFSSTGGGAAIQAGTGAIVAGANGITLGGVNQTSWPVSGGQWATSGTNIYSTNSGNVGIGLTNPTYKLHVVGNIYASGSSILYKENVSDLKIDTSKLYLLNPVSFDFKPEYQDLGLIRAGGQEFGLIAEDVAKIIPELAIKEYPQGPVSNVDYEKLSVLLLQELKNQKKILDELSAENSQLNLRLDVLERKLK